MLALCSHETAEVLSPRARKQQYFSGKSSRIVSQTDTKEAKNSKLLFSFLTRVLYSVGISQCQARPLSL